jgi:hypothetical protein
MYRLVYSSMEAEPFGLAPLKALLLKSRLRNSGAGITGMLIYDGGAFLQALEGDRSAVAATLARIERDPRHRNVTVLFRDEAATERQFGQWSMGYADASEAAAMLRGFKSLEGGLRVPALDRSTALKLLQGLAEAV